MYKTIAFCSSPQPCYCGLIWDRREEDIKMILEIIYMLWIHTSQLFRQKVENSGTSNSQCLLPSFPHQSWGRSQDIFGDNTSSSPSFTRCESHIVARDHPLAYLPQKNDLVSLSAPFLRVESKLWKLLPVVQAMEHGVLDLVDEVVLHRLQLVYGFLVHRRPQLRAVIHFGLY